MRSSARWAAAFATASVACGGTVNSVGTARPADGSGGGASVDSGAGAAVREAGVSGSGGARHDASAGTRGSGGDAPCSSAESECPASIELPSRGTLGACCTRADTCGFDTAVFQAYQDVAEGCQALGQPGMPSDDCPDTSTGQRCCRFDGTCGTDLSTYGLGCVPSESEAGTGQKCQLTGECRFVFRVTTVTANGKYSPQNVGAVWIEDGSGNFVRTLDAWGQHFLSNASAWITKTGGNTVDAITAATRHFQGPLIATWNCLDTARAPAPPGPYRLCMTFIEEPHVPFIDSGTIPDLCVPFDLTDAPLDITPAPTPYFRDMHLSKD